MRLAEARVAGHGPEAGRSSLGDKRQTAARLRRHQRAHDDDDDDDEDDDIDRRQLLDVMMEHNR